MHVFRIVIMEYISDTFLHSLSIMYLFVSNLLLNIHIYMYIGIDCS